MSKTSNIRPVSLFKRKICSSPFRLQAPSSETDAMEQGGSRWASLHRRDSQTFAHKEFRTPYLKQQSLPSVSGIRKKTNMFSSMRASPFNYQTMIVTPSTIISEFLKLFPPRDVRCLDGSRLKTTPGIQYTSQDAYSKDTDIMMGLATGLWTLHGSSFNRQGLGYYSSQNMEGKRNSSLFKFPSYQKYLKNDEAKPREGINQFRSVPFSSQCFSEASFDWDRLFLIRVATVAMVEPNISTLSQVLPQSKLFLHLPTSDMFNEKSRIHAKAESSTSDDGSDKRSIDHTCKESLWLSMIDTFLRKRNSSKTDAECVDSDYYAEENSCMWETPAVYYMYYYNSGSIYKAVGRFYAIPGLPQPPTNLNYEWTVNDITGAGLISQILCKRSSSTSTNPFSSFNKANMVSRNLNAAREECKSHGGDVGKKLEQRVAEDDVVNGEASPLFSTPSEVSPQVWHRIRATATVMTLNEYISFICPSYCDGKHERTNVALDGLDQGSSFKSPACTFVSHSNELKNEPADFPAVPRGDMPLISAASKASYLKSELPGKKATKSRSGDLKLGQNLVCEDGNSIGADIHPSYPHSQPEPHISGFTFARPQSYVDQRTSRGCTGLGLHSRREDVSGGVMNWWSVPLNAHLRNILPFVGGNGAMGVVGTSDCPAGLGWEATTQSWIERHAVGVLLLLAEECVYFEMLLHVHNPLGEGGSAPGEASRQLSFPQLPLLCTRAEDQERGSFGRVVHRMDLPFSSPLTEGERGRVDGAKGATAASHPPPHRHFPGTILVYEAWNAYATNTPFLRVSDKGTGKLKTESKGKGYSKGWVPCGAALESSSELHIYLLNVHLNSKRTSGEDRAEGDMTRDQLVSNYAISTQSKADKLKSNEQRDNFKLTHCKLNPASSTINSLSGKPFVAFSPFPPSTYLLKKRAWFERPFVLAEEMRYGLLIRYTLNI
ncbi:unnamed protein product [Phytomonas sp. Hart1]|nr:unnamed protein product [Phytomonas sp. Hart1]|eukprot:CCW70423.1 unnamed protein product [Phytomonas sp. isolate Hart1]